MKLAIAFLSAAAVLSFSAGRTLAETVEVKGPHICCGQCVKVAEGLLKKIDGVTDAKADAKAKSVTFTATDAKAAKAGLKALIDGGFFGAAKCDDKVISIDVPKGDGKADEVVVEKVHMCCGQCHTAAKNLFKDAKVTIEGAGPQRTVRIQGTNLDRADVLDTLRKSGFNGTLAK